MSYRNINTFIFLFINRFTHYLAGVQTCILICIFIFPQRIYAQDETEFIDIPVSVSMRELGQVEVPALIKDELLYLSVTDLFVFLKINSQHSSEMDSISGFILNPSDPFLISFPDYRISYQHRNITVLQDDLMRSGDKLFLRSNYFGEVFGLTCTFSLRSLSVTLDAKSELPAIRAIRLEKLNLNFNKADLAFKADTTIGRKFRLFHLGSADWSVNASQQVASPGYARVGMALGGVLAGGEVKAIISHTTDRPFIAKNQFYLWRYANNNNKVIRQVMAGKILVRSISSVFDPIIGVQITNSPTYYRRAFGFYSYQGYTEPDGLVELYVNNILLDYIRADALGFIQYEIPLSYGNTNVRLRYYGPSGEETTDEKTFLIPLSFLPESEIEYTLSAGFVEDREGSFYSQGRVNYGVTAQVTVGGGLEYISSAENIQSLPFLTTSVRLAPNMFFSGDYIAGTRYKGQLTYFSSSRLQFELQYVKYNIPQEAIKYNYAEERKALVSMPFRIGTCTAMSRLSFNQNMLGDLSYYNVEMQLSLATRDVNLNISQSALFRTGLEANMYSTISSSIRLPGRMRLSPRIIYNLTDKELVSMNVGIEKNVTRFLSVNASYEQRFDHLTRAYRIGFRYILPFAHLSSMVSMSKNATVFSQSASGSMIYEKKLGGAVFTKNSNVGRGEVGFSAFLDLNANGKKDFGETTVKGFKVKIHSGGGKKISTDSTVIYSGLEPYLTYNFTMDGNGFENISWKVIHSLFSVLIDPNQLKWIEVAVVSVGEASGKVFLKNESGVKNGIGQVSVDIYNLTTGEVVSTVTESDGYFSYLGLMPGDYRISVGEAFLAKRNMTATEWGIFFSIQENIEGDVIDDLEITLTGMSKE